MIEVTATTVKLSSVIDPLAEAGFPQESCHVAVAVTVIVYVPGVQMLAATVAVVLLKDDIETPAGPVIDQVQEGEVHPVQG